MPFYQCKENNQHLSFRSPLGRHFPSLIELFSPLYSSRTERNSSARITYQPIVDETFSMETYSTKLFLMVIRVIWYVGIIATMDLDGQPSSSRYVLLTI